MTVKELIEELKKMPEDDLVIVDEYEVTQVIKNNECIHLW